MLESENSQILYHSKSVVEILAATTPIHVPFVGRDIFWVIADCAISPPRNLKSDIKKALSAGQAISTTIRVATPRANATQPPGETKYVTHWTPLKDERGAVTYVVMTLST